MLHRLLLKDTRKKSNMKSLVLLLGVLVLTSTTFSFENIATQPEATDLKNSKATTIQSGGLPGFPGGFFPPNMPGIPGFSKGWGNIVDGYGGGYGGPKGGFSTGGVIRPSVVCSERGPCYKRRLTCPAKCFTYYSRSGKNYGGGGGGGGCRIDCKKNCIAYC